MRYTVKCSNVVNFGARKTFFFLNWLEFWTKFFKVESGASQPLKTKPILLLQRDSGWKKENCHFQLNHKI